MDKRWRPRFLQTAGIAAAFLMAASDIAFLAAVALEVLDQQEGRRGSNSAFPSGGVVWLAIGLLLAVALAVLVALPLRFYGNKPVRILGYAGCGCLGVSALGLGTFVLALLAAQGLGAYFGSMLPLAVVAGLSSLGAAIVLFMKSRAGEEEAR